MRIEIYANVHLFYIDWNVFGNVDVEVARLATVAELKQAVEGVFAYMPREGDGMISWYFSFQIN